MNLRGLKELFCVPKAESIYSVLGHKAITSPRHLIESHRRALQSELDANEKIASEIGGQLLIAKYRRLRLCKAIANMTDWLDKDDAARAQR